MAYIPSRIRARVAERAEYRCEYCQSQEAILGMPFEIDHILPLSAGGRTEESNLCLACPRCNRYKGSQFEGFDSESEGFVTLFHPRQHEWQEHFSWTPDGLRIIGLTPTGRATIEALQLNNSFIVRSRYEWVSLGWHPATPDR